jgi:flagellar hook-associated protein 1 FlgK
MGNLSLDIGLRSLLTAQANLETIGHNVTNASTPGYSRQQLLVSAAPGFRLRGLILGRGVQADVVRRTVDGLLQARLARQDSVLGRLDARLDGLTAAEMHVGSTGDHGVPARLAALFASLSTLSTSPNDPLLRSGAVQSAADLASTIQSAARGLHDLQTDTRNDLAATIEQVNGLAKEIGELNQRIPDLEGNGQVANDLRDRRDQAVRELSQLVDAQSVEEPVGGAVRILVGGHMLVSPTKTSALVLEHDPSSGAIALRMGSAKGPEVNASGGRVAGLVGLLQDTLPKLASELDGYARGLALEMNRIHTTGVAGDGPFTFLASANAVEDADKSGSIGDELLTQAGLPFEIRSGSLFVNVTDLATGSLTKQEIAIDAARTTVGDLVAALDSIAGLSARLDARGRLELLAAPGFGFDFSPRLDPNPDPIGSFGGAQASLAAGPGPFPLAPGDTLDLVGPAGAFTVTFSASSFQQIGQATAEELAAALNADPNVQANGLQASVVADRVVLQTLGTGSGQSFTVSGGSALGALGWAAGTVVTGHDQGVQVSVSGAFSGSSNGQWTFVPTGDGTVGETAGLSVEVRAADGSLVATLDVGEGYAPLDEIELPDGVRVSFGAGELSASHGDVFELDVVADSDQTDTLVALGVNVLFTGADAANLAVRADLQADSQGLSLSLTGAAGDAGNALRLLELDGKSLPDLGGSSLSDAYGALSSGVGLEIDGARATREAESLLQSSLQTRRDELSGVNVDEELVHMIEQEQAYAAASQYLRVVSDLQNELLNIL